MIGDIHVILETEYPIGSPDAFASIRLARDPLGRSCHIGEGFWCAVEPLLPIAGRLADRSYVRRPGGGRKAKPTRLIFEGILHVLRERCAWKDLPAQRYGSYSAVQQRYMGWSQAGVFDAIWKAGLANAPEFAGVRWGWQRLGPAMLAPPAEPMPPALGPSEPAGSLTHGFAWRPILTGGHRIRNSPRQRERGEGVVVRGAKAIHLHAQPVL